MGPMAKKAQIVNIEKQVSVPPEIHTRSFVESKRVTTFKIRDQEGA